MRTLYLECNMGAAGDMLTAALLELVPDREKVLKQLNSLGLPHVKAAAEKSVKCGITGTHMKVTVDGEEEESLDVNTGQTREHKEESARGSGHEHHHGHHHTSLKDVEHYIDQMPLSKEVKQDIRNVYALIAKAEGHAHGMSVDQIHFHEVGTMDAIFDVTAVCYLMNLLHPEQVIASPVRTGFGEVKCAHGIMPVPAPATAYLLQNIPSYAGEIRGEMCTPTGAALLKYFVREFSWQPVMRVEKIGYGMGTKDFPAANCIRAFLGETGEEEDRILELRMNIDDMTGEEIGFAMEQLLKAGARDVFTTPIGMKKNRPGILLTVICTPADKAKMTEAIFKYTTTLGIRETVCRRNVLFRSEETLTTAYGDVRVKTSSGYGTVKKKAEYEDLRKIAEETGLSLTEVRQKLKEKEPENTPARD